MKRRESQVAKPAVTPRPKGKVVASMTDRAFEDCFKTPPGVEPPAKGC